MVSCCEGLVRSGVWKAKVARQAGRKAKAIKAAAGTGRRHTYSGRQQYIATGGTAVDDRGQ